MWHTGTGHVAYQNVVKELLRQAETQCYKQGRRLVWLQAVKPIFKASSLCCWAFSPKQAQRAKALSQYWQHGKICSAERRRLHSRLSVMASALHHSWGLCDACWMSLLWLLIVQWLLFSLSSHKGPEFRNLGNLLAMPAAGLRPWQHVLCSVLQVLGLHVLRFFSTLMPLLLGWCQEPDQATCLAALQALREVIKHTWPRMRAHASFLWQQLQHISMSRSLHGGNAQACKGDGLLSADADIQSCVANIAEMLYLCGGPPFQETMHDAWVSSKNPAADVMLDAIKLHIAPEQTV